MTDLEVWNSLNRVELALMLRLGPVHPPPGFRDRQARIVEARALLQSDAAHDLWPRKAKRVPLDAETLARDAAAAREEQRRRFLERKASTAA